MGGKGSGKKIKGNPHEPTKSGLTRKFVVRNIDFHAGGAMPYTIQYSKKKKGGN